MLSADYRFSLCDEKLPFGVNDGDVPIFDMAGFSYRHLAKLSLSTIRCYMKFTQEAFPVRLKQGLKVFFEIWTFLIKFLFDSSFDQRFTSFVESFDDIETVYEIRRSRIAKLSRS